VICSSQEDDSADPQKWSSYCFSCMSQKGKGPDLRKGDSRKEGKEKRRGCKKGEKGIGLLGPGYQPIEQSTHPTANQKKGSMKREKKKMLLGGGVRKT